MGTKTLKIKIHQAKEMAEKMHVIRDKTKKDLGVDYDEFIAPFIEFIKEHMKMTRHGAILSALECMEEV